MKIQEKDNRKVVLIVNHTNVECGTFQFVSRIMDLVCRSDEVAYYLWDIGNHEVYEKALEHIKPDYVLYNYHFDRMGWLKPEDITNRPNIKHYFIFHDGSMLSAYDKYLFFGELDPGGKCVPEEKRIVLPRPLLKYTGKYPENKIVTIGSFGFSTPSKRFPELVKMVNDTFPEAIIRLHLAETFFGDNFGYSVKDTVSACKKNNTNPNVKLVITNNFVNNSMLLEFLAGNDINVFYYDILTNPGLSSATDYALSVRRPIAVTKNMTFRHIASDDILMEKNTLQEILNRGTKPLEKFYDMWSPLKFREEMDKIFK